MGLVASKNKYKKQTSNCSFKGDQKAKTIQGDRKCLMQNQGKVSVSFLGPSQQELCLFRGEANSVTSASGPESLNSRFGEENSLILRA